MEANFYPASQLFCISVCQLDFFVERNLFKNDLMLLQQFDARGRASPVVPGPRSQLHTRGTCTAQSPEPPRRL